MAAPLLLEELEGMGVPDPPGGGGWPISAVELTDAPGAIWDGEAGGDCSLNTTASAPVGSLLWAASAGGTMGPTIRPEEGAGVGPDASSELLAGRGTPRAGDSAINGAGTWFGALLWGEATVGLG